MPIVRLSPAFVRNVQCPSEQKKIDYFDMLARGLMLEVRSLGGKTFYQRYTDERGRERQCKIGPADVLTLRQAKRKAKHAGSEDQFRQCASLSKTVILPFVRTYKRSWQTDEIVLRVHALPRLGHLFLDEITTERITEIIA